jgi:hypothetical protein
MNTDQLILDKLASIEKELSKTKEVLMMVTGHKKQKELRTVNDYRASIRSKTFKKHINGKSR